MAQLLTENRQNKRKAVGKRAMLSVGEHCSEPRKRQQWRPHLRAFAGSGDKREEPPTMKDAASTCLSYQDYMEDAGNVRHHGISKEWKINSKGIRVRDTYGTVRQRRVIGS